MLIDLKIFPIIKVKANKTVNKINIVKSKIKLFVFKESLLINNDILNTKRILIVLEPNILPKTKLYSLFLAAFNEATNSGSDVPKAIAVAPITISGILKNLAIAIDPSIKQ